MWDVPGGGGSVECGIDGCLFFLVSLIFLLPVSHEVSSFTSTHASCCVISFTMTHEQWSQVTLN